MQLSLRMVLKQFLFLQNSLENLAVSNRENFILDFIEKHRDKNIAMVVAPIQLSQGKMIEKRVLEAVKNENFKFKVFKFDVLENDKEFDRDYLIIPSFMN